jgi:hypothetical protein
MSLLIRVIRASQYGRKYYLSRAQKYCCHLIATKSSVESHEMVLGLHSKINGVKIIAFMIDHILWWKYKQLFTLGHLLCHIEPRGGMCLIYYM